jgi:hypothetical protein
LGSIGKRNYGEAPVLGPAFSLERHLAHQREGMAVGIAEEGEPELVLLHAGSELRRLDKCDPGGEERCVRCVDVRHFEIEDGL